MTFNLLVRDTELWVNGSTREYSSAPFIRDGRITNKELNTANQTGLYWSLFHNVIDQRSILNLVILNIKIIPLHFLPWESTFGHTFWLKSSSTDSCSHQKQCSWGGWRRCMHDILNFVTFCKAHKYETFRYLQIHNIMSHLIVVPAKNNSYIEIAAKMYCSGSFVMPRMKIAGIYIHPGSLPSRLPSPWFTLLEYGFRKDIHK